MRILLAQNDVAAYLSELQKGFLDLGVECDALFVSNHRFGTKAPRELNSIGITFIRFLHKLYSKKRSNKYISILLYYVFLLVKKSYFIVSLPYFIYKYDVFVYAFGHPLLDGFDIPIIRFFNRKVICVFQGSDARPGYIGVPAFDFPIKRMKKYVKNQKTIIKRIERFGGLSIVHPTSGYFFEKPFIKWMEIGTPKKLLVAKASSLGPSSDDIVRIIHAPSSTKGKGTGTIRKYVKKLQEKYNIEYVELVNVSNTKVLEEVANADFIVDQLGSDAALGGLGAEAAFFDVPTVVSGSFSKATKKIHEQEIIPPSLYVQDEDYLEAIEKMIVDKEFRVHLGKKAGKFVRDKWDSTRVARNFMKIIKNEVPESWYFNPYDLNEFYPYGVSQSELKEYAQKMTREYGVNSLCLSDKPYLEKLILDTKK